MARVRIKQGELQGTLGNLPSGNTYASFKGIPYAKPPIGELRFKAPQPPESWIGVRNATKHGNICPQVDMLTGQISSDSEDCLFLNVYTPSINLNNLPVMVWFHGGAFQFGSGNSDIYGPDFLIEEGVVVVTVNYRLEVLGFLCLDTKDVPGNAGMKDQVAALKWVKDNIAQFGGDPGNVTIFGESAGAASVTYHLVSPMSKGLFNKVIAQSGCFLNRWSYIENAKNIGLRLAKYFGNESKDPNELGEFLRSLPANKLVQVSEKVSNEKEKLRSLSIILAPTVEKEFDGEEAFLTKSALKLLEEGDFVKVPIIIGYNDFEGLMMLRLLKNANGSQIISTIRDRLPLAIQETVKENKLQEIIKDVEDFYLKNRNDDEQVLIDVANMETDIMFLYQTKNWCTKIMERSQYPIYFYRFSYDGKMNMPKLAMGMGDMKGACHADDIFYLFKTPFDIENNSQDWKVMKRMCKMWTNFAKYGNPTPGKDELVQINWKPMAIDEFNYVNIDSELTLGKNPDGERIQFWDDMYERVSKLKENVKCNL